MISKLQTSYIPNVYLLDGYLDLRTHGLYIQHYKYFISPGYIGKHLSHNILK